VSKRFDLSPQEGLYQSIIGLTKAEVERKFGTVMRDTSDGPVVYAVVLTPTSRWIPDRSVMSVDFKGGDANNRVEKVYMSLESDGKKSGKPTLDMLRAVGVNIPPYRALPSHYRPGQYFEYGNDKFKVILERFGDDDVDVTIERRSP
jgi:hypothetical protein